ncbi:TATA-box-binding protein [Natrinema sp. CBA1119]|uniref:TATA-box-binding protein n=1 Tax=Natrinema sp. CBA1119 TaxID=1608465 RepID=UPI000BF378C3|nr:TATA-box-binding protein [Natrinema sp. CBA1119]PGF14589.1 TATA-box-binding protein [Natrinema sp. CBA1119]
MTDLTDTLSTENVVASTSIDQELNLEALSNDLNGVDYNPEQFPGLVYRTNNPKAATLIFRSGKMVCTGASSVDDVNSAISITFDQLQELGIEIPDDPEIIIQNIVTSGDLGKTLNLNGAAIGLGLERIEYEPEQFPGLVYRGEDLDAVALLFGSGKIIITGGTEIDEARDVIQNIASKLQDLGLL